MCRSPQYRTVSGTSNTRPEPGTALSSQPFEETVLPASILCAQLVSDLLFGVSCMQDFAYVLI